MAPRRTGWEKPEQFWQLDQNLTNFISSFRTDLASDLASDFHVAVGHLGASTATTNVVGYAEVQNAQAAVAARDANVSLIPTSSLALSDNVHLDESGQQALGIGFAGAFLGQTPDLQLVNGSFEFSPQNNDCLLYTSPSPRDS